MPRPLISLAALLGCAAVAPPPPAPRPAPRASATRVAPIRYAGMRGRVGVGFFLDDFRGALRWPLRVEGHSALWVRGGERHEVTGDGDRAADEVLASEIRGAAPTASGWRFVTASEVWESDDWGGPLRLVARWPDATPCIAPGLPVALREGELLGAAAALSAWVLDAGFLDERRGFALIAPGHLLQTDDGGVTWRPLSAPARPIAEMRLRAGALQVVTGGWEELTWWVRTDGRWTHVDALQRQDPPPLHHARGPFRFAVPLQWDHGRVALIGDERFDTYDLAADRALATEEAPCPVAQAFFSGSLFVVCRREGRDEVLERDGATWRTRLRFVSDGQGPCVASADGRDLACSGVCDPGVSVPARAACAVRDGAEPQQVVWGEGTWRPLGFAAGELVAVGRARRLRDVRVRVGAEAPRPLVGSGVDDDLLMDLGAPRLDHAGRWHLVAYTARLAPLVLDGAPGGAWTRRPPPPAEHVELCGDQGVALAHDDDGGVWVSESPEARWRSLPVRDMGPGLRRVRCTDSSWHVEVESEEGRGGLQPSRWTGGVGWGPTIPGEGTLRGATTPPDDPPPRGERWRCVSEAAAAVAAGAVDREAPEVLRVASGGRALTYDRASNRLWGSGVSPTFTSSHPGGSLGGAYSLDGAVGLLAVRGDQRVVAITLDGALRPLGAWPRRACDAAARGDLALFSAIWFDDETFEHAALRMGLDAAGLCVRGASAAGLRLRAEGDALVGDLRRAGLRVGIRCVLAAEPDLAAAGGARRAGP